MPSLLIATEVAFVMAAVVQGVLAVVWVIGARVAGEARAAAMHWAGYAAFSVPTFLLMVAAMRSADPARAEVLRAIGNISGVLAILSLQRGIRLFVGRQPPHVLPWVAMAIVLFASWIGLDPAAGHIRVGVISGVLMLLTVAMAIDVRMQARDELHVRWPWLFALPVLFGGIGFGLRGLRALAQPESVAAEMTVDSAVNVVSAIGYVVIALAFHATLVALVVSQLISRLQRASRHDGLTGLLNRRAIEETLAAEVQRSRRLHQPFCVLMLDADHFKSINDLDGHAAGDRALQHLATILGAQMRGIDSVGRYGGEEFVVVLPGTSQADALNSAQRLCERVASVPAFWQDKQLPLTVSIGVSQWAGDDDDVAALLARADAALYCAKQAGRNCVIAAPLKSDVAGPPLRSVS